MTLNVSYCKYNSYSPFSSFSVSNNSIVLYLTNDDGTYTYVDSFIVPIINSDFSHDFTISGDTNQYSLNIDTSLGIMIDAIDSSSTYVNLPFDVYVDIFLFSNFFIQSESSMLEDISLKVDDILDGGSTLYSSISQLSTSLSSHSDCKYAHTWPPIRINIWPLEC